MARLISQREARRLRKEVVELRERERVRLAVWSSDYPGGVHIDTVRINSTEVAIAETAAKLGFVIVAKPANNTLRLYAVKP